MQKASIAEQDSDIEKSNKNLQDPSLRKDRAKKTVSPTSNQEHSANEVSKRKSIKPRKLDTALKRLRTPCSSMIGKEKLLKIISPIITIL